MTPRTPTDSLAQATAALLREHDITDVLHHLTQDAVHFSGGDAGGVLVRTNGELEMLSATSHTATHLELYQAQRTEGPCVDVFASESPVEAAGVPEILERWPHVGPAIVDAGYRSVFTTPLVWQGGVLGGLNVFGREPVGPSEEQRRILRAFADMLTLAVAQPDHLGAEELTRHVARALAGRAAVEQAKGALAYLLGVDMGAAYDELVRRSEQQGRSLSATALDILSEAQRPR
ncbi:GAF and ANTAR domain-containing protein [Cellulosimicrobium cellulans]|uniref:GAF and ANTAR domain-containing protein n=1 Tax=Cellulosimicrobium cellulans TaxID=1710 RepID=UPI002097A92A|nr:GAF and ANTAR domain-containing protein [Cellulosimicrobium cellulans]MCO7273304.1 GAF and ANTAR domain-containing protein [Cellulosimicrobium cellulans]